MVQFRPAAREIVAKVVYYGPPLGGKTTNLRMLWEGYPPEVRGELIVLPTGSDRTIYFDYLPLTFHKLRGLEVKIQLYTVPGQVRFDSTRQVVLKGVDGVVFVADSQRQAAAANRESWLNLKNNLSKQGLFLDHLPHVLQYNKRDLSDLIPVEDLNAELNEFNAPFFEAVAVQGIGVEETLQGIVRLVVRSLRDRFNLPVEAPGGARTFPTPVPAQGEPELARDEHETGRVSVVPFPVPPPEVTPPTLPLVKPGWNGELPSQDVFSAPTVPAKESSEGQPAAETASPGEFVGPSEGADAPLTAPSIEEEPEAVALDEDAASSLSLASTEGTATRPPEDLALPVFETTPFPAEEVTSSREPGLEISLQPIQGELGLTQASQEPEKMAVSPEENTTMFTPEAAPWEEPFSLVEEPQTPPVVEEALSLESGEVLGPDPFPVASLSSAGPLAGEDVFAIVPAPTGELLAPKVTLEKVPPKVVARHGEVRELEVEVPVPAIWVGGRRVALQLRLILVPEEENHEP